MDFDWQAVSSSAPIILTVLGMLVSLAPNMITHKWVKMCLAGVFLAIGMFAWVADIQVRKEDRLEKERLRADITGGDNFPYLVPEITAETKIDEPIPLRLLTGKNAPLFNVKYWVHPQESQGNAKDSTYWKGGGDQIDFVYAWGAPPKIAVSLGDWRIELDARNGHWIQYLHVTSLNGRPFFQTTVVRNGQTIFDGKSQKAEK